MEEIEQGSEGVSTPESNESSSTSSSPETSQESSQPHAAEARSQESEYVPYARFKELVAEKNETAQRYQSQAQQLEQVQRSLQQLQSQYAKQAQPARPANPVIERLKSVDPEFAELMSKQLEANERLQQQLEQVNQWRSTSQEETMRKSAETNLSDLYSKHSVAKFDQPLYRKMIEASVYQRELNGERLGVEHLPQIFADIHREMMAHTKARNESYVSSKAKDQTPASVSQGIPNKGTSNADGKLSIDDVKAQFARSVREGGRPF